METILTVRISETYLLPCHKCYTDYAHLWMQRQFLEQAWGPDFPLHAVQAEAISNEEYLLTLHTQI